jgi:hypothetical protein
MPATGAAVIALAGVAAPKANAPVIIMTRANNNFLIAFLSPVPSAKIKNISRQTALQGGSAPPARSPLMQTCPLFERPATPVTFLNSLFIGERTKGLFRPLLAHHFLRNRQGRFSK